jgi:Na+:H+ antiporter, NhaA family
MKIKNKIWDNLPEGNALSGIILIACTIFSLLMSNFFVKQPYLDFWQTDIGGMSILTFINDVLMTIFFLIVGLEIKKELVVGELKSFKKAFLPFICAVGGMIVPALIYVIFNYDTDFFHGWGIPTATDIAFSIGILAILGSKIPQGLKVFLTALAIIDDLGAVLVIAIFYSQSISFLYLLLAIICTLLLFLIQKYLKFYNLIVWLTVGCAIWYFLHHSGIHATIAGILIAIVTPINFKGEEPLDYLVGKIHNIVNYFVIPIFAIANTAILVEGDLSTVLKSSISLGIIFGLFVGKPLGIMAFAFISTKLGLAHLPNKVGWNLIFGAAILAGIGFTMSLFVSFLAFTDSMSQDIAKIAILIGSLLACVTGFLYLKFTLKKIN